MGVDRRMEEQATRVHAIVEERVQQQLDAVLSAEMERIRKLVDLRVQERVGAAEERLIAVVQDTDRLRTAFAEHSDLCLRSLVWALSPNATGIAARVFRFVSCCRRRVLNASSWLIGMPPEDERRERLRARLEALSPKAEELRALAELRARWVAEHAAAAPPVPQPEPDLETGTDVAEAAAPLEESTTYTQTDAQTSLTGIEDDDEEGSVEEMGLVPNPITRLVSTETDDGEEEDEFDDYYFEDEYENSSQHLSQFLPKEAIMEELIEDDTVTWVREASSQNDDGMEHGAEAGHSRAVIHLVDSEDDKAEYIAEPCEMTNPDVGVYEVMEVLGMPSPVSGPVDEVLQELVVSPTPHMLEEETFQNDEVLAVPTQTSSESATEETVVLVEGEAA